MDTKSKEEAAAAEYGRQIKKHFKELKVVTPGLPTPYKEWSGLRNAPPFEEWIAQADPETQARHEVQRQRLHAIHESIQAKKAEAKATKAKATKAKATKAKATKAKVAKAKATKATATATATAAMRKAALEKMIADVRTQAEADQATVAVMNRLFADRKAKAGTKATAKVAEQPAAVSQALAKAEDNPVLNPVICLEEYRQAKAKADDQATKSLLTDPGTIACRAHAYDRAMYVWMELKNNRQGWGGMKKGF